jgi:streptogramin lyase
VNTALLLLALAPTADITTVAGTGKPGDTGDGGLAAKATLNGPFACCLDADGNLYFSDTGNHRVRKVDATTGTITTVAGKGKKGFGGDGGPGTEALLNEPYGVAIDAAGDLLIVDRLNAAIRKVERKTGRIVTVAGTGKPGDGQTGDGGPATKAALKEPNGVAVDARGRVLIADVAAQRVRILDPATGTIDTFCGTGEKKSAGDGGPAGKAALQGARAVAVGPDGAIYICEREGNRIRRMDPRTGAIAAFAGTGKKGYTGDGGPATAATFNGPKELAVDGAGNVFVVDTENHAIRRIDAKTGVITTIAGDGKAGGAGDGGPATAARLDRPHGVCVAPDGTVYIGDTNNHRVRKVAGGR